MPDVNLLMDQVQSDIAKAKRLGKTLNMLFSVLVAIMTTFAFVALVKPSQSTSKVLGEDLAKYKQEVDVLRSKLKQIEELQSKPAGKLSENYCMNDLKTNFDNRLSRIEGLLQDDPVRSLAVLLVRRDLDNINIRMTEYQVAVREDVNRIYSIFMWAFGFLMASVAWIFTYFQRKLDTFTANNEKSKPQSTGG